MVMHVRLIRNVLMMSLQLIFVAAFADEQPAPLLKQLLSDLNVDIETAVAQNQVVGSAVAVVEKDKTVFMKTYGVRRRGEEDLVDTDTLFQLGSVSKPIAATFFAAANKNDLVDLNSTVLCPGGSSKNIKASHILSHSTGFERYGWNKKIERGGERERLLKDLCQSKINAPGEQFDYHNLAYSLIEDLLESKTDMPFKAGLKSYLLEPAGMTRTYAGYFELLSDTNRAWPHVALRRKGWTPSQRYSRGYHESAVAAGGINSCVKDMANFLKLQLGFYPELLTSEDLKSFHAPVIRAPDAQAWFRRVSKAPAQTYYGYGWRIAELGGERIVFHTGWVKGFTNLVAFSPKYKVGIVVLNNSESKFSFRTGMGFMRKLLGKDGPAPQRKILAKKKRGAKKAINKKATQKKKAAHKKVAQKKKAAHKKVAQKKTAQKKPGQKKGAPKKVARKKNPSDKVS